MRHPHTLRRALLATAMALAAVPLLASPASAAVVKPIVFPVDGPVTYTDTFGACRDGCTRRHEGNDLMGRKMLPLLAAVDGVVSRVTFANTSTGGNSVTIKAADGWTYHYLHVNNDTPGTDDARATREQAFPSYVQVGATVRRGQVVGYLGDSGNAEDAGSHLHFEIRQPAAPGTYTGTAIDPYESLRNAVVWSTVSSWELRATATAGSPDEAFTYGTVIGDRGLLCDWDGDGASESVIYRGGTWFARAGTSSGVNARQFAFGTASDTPLCGDVDGDGADEPILFRDGTWTIRAGFEATDAVAWTARFGTAVGDKPVVGDWDGEGHDDFAIKRADTWYIRSTAQPSGASTHTFRFGTLSTDLPVAGDWDGDGDDDPGIFRTGAWYLRSTAAAAGSVSSPVAFGRSSALPLVGTRTGTAAPMVGTFRPRTA